MYTKEPFIVHHSDEQVIRNTALALALLTAGHSVKPSQVKEKAKIDQRIPLTSIQSILDKLHEKNINIRRQITTEGTSITFLYVLKTQPAALKYGFVENLNLSLYNQNLCIAYDAKGRFSGILFNTEDKMQARKDYKQATGTPHNDVRMVKVSSYNKNSEN